MNPFIKRIQIGSAKLPQLKKLPAYIDINIPFFCIINSITIFLLTYIISNYTLYIDIVISLGLFVSIIIFHLFKDKSYYNKIILLCILLHIVSLSIIIFGVNINNKKENDDETDYKKNERFNNFMENFFSNYLIFVTSCYIIIKLLENQLTRIPFLSILLFTIIIYFSYLTLLANIDILKWHKIKCKNSYLLSSGLIRQDKNKTIYDSTESHFNDCIKNNLDLDKIENSLDFKLNQMNSETNNNIQTKYRDFNNNKISTLENSLSKLNDLKNLTNSKKNSKNSLLTGANTEITQFVNTINNIKEYAHSYLTYSILNFAIKYKKQSEYDEKCGPGVETVQIDCSNGSYDPNIYPCFKYTGKEWSDISHNFCIVYNEISMNENIDLSMSKTTFFKTKAIEQNEIAKQYFGGNKL